MSLLSLGCMMINIKPCCSSFKDAQINHSIILKALWNAFLSVSIMFWTYMSLQALASLRLSLITLQELDFTKCPAGKLKV